MYLHIEIFSNSIYRYQYSICLQSQKGITKLHNTSHKKCGSTRREAAANEHLHNRRPH